MEMDMGNSTCSDSMMGMKMSFFFGYQCSLLFSSFNLQTPGQLFGGFLLVFVSAVLYEGLKTLREYLAAKEIKWTGGGDTNINQSKGDRTPLLAPKGSKWMVLLKGYSSPLHIVVSLLHVVQVGAAYLLMLVAMTYNGWLFLAVCFGAGLGYYLFGKCRNISDFKSQSEHCH